MQATTRSAAALFRLGHSKPESRCFFDFAKLLGMPRPLVPLVTIKPRDPISALEAMRLLHDNLAMGARAGLVRAEEKSLIDRRLVSIVDFLERALGRDKPPSSTRLGTVCTALTQIGQVRALKGESPDDSGRKPRVGWQRLDEYFSVAFGNGYRQPLKAHVKYQMHELPPWCGVFAVWALKSAGVRCRNYKPGKGIIEILKSTSNPQPGDIAILEGSRMHMCLVIDTSHRQLMSADGNINAAGSATGGQIDRQLRPLSRVRAFYSQSQPLPL